MGAAAAAGAGEKNPEPVKNGPAPQHSSYGTVLHYSWSKSKSIGITQVRFYALTALSPDMEIILIDFCNSWPFLTPTQT